MRGYTRERAPAALREVFNIGKRAGCGVHVSHFKLPRRPNRSAARRSTGRRRDVTFDLYCYCTAVHRRDAHAPPETLEGGIEATVERLKLPATRKETAVAFATPRFPIETSGSPACARQLPALEGQTLPDAAAHCGQTVLDFTCDLLIATDLAAGVCDPALRERQESDIQKLMKHPLMMAGATASTWAGSRTCAARGASRVPRASRPRRRLVARRSCHEMLVPPSARRFGLKDRGLIREGSRPMWWCSTRTRSPTVRPMMTARHWRWAWNTCS